MHGQHIKQMYTRAKNVLKECMGGIKYIGLAEPHSCTKKDVKTRWVGVGYFMEWFE